MGASQSSQKEHVVTPPQEGTSVDFSPSLISRLMTPSTPSGEASTDELVRRRLAQESAAIRAKEAEILSSISAALEKENIDKDAGLSSEVLGRDIDEVREKVERMALDKKNRETAALARAKEGVIACYRTNQDRPLDCWREVEAFKAEVSKLEQAFVKSLQ